MLQSFLGEATWEFLYLNIPEENKVHREEMGAVYCCDVLSTKQAGKEQVVQQTCRRKMRSLPCAVFE